MAIATADDLSKAIGTPFSDQQLTAITAPPEPGVIVAGAGTGKTTVMAARVVWLVSNGLVRRDQVLGLTFTNKAAAELGARTDPRCPRQDWWIPQDSARVGPTWGLGAKTRSARPPWRPTTVRGRLIGRTRFATWIEPTLGCSLMRRGSARGRRDRRHPGPTRNLSTRTDVGGRGCTGRAVRDQQGLGRGARVHRGGRVELDARTNRAIRHARATNLKRDGCSLVERDRESQRRHEVMDFQTVALGAASRSCPESGHRARPIRVVLSTNTRHFDRSGA